MDITVKEGYGILFINRSNNSKAPQWKGKLMVDGQEYDVAMWEQTNKDGKAYKTMALRKLDKKVPF